MTSIGPIGCAVVWGSGDPIGSIGRAESDRVARFAAVLERYPGMDATTPQPLSSTTRIELVRLSRRGTDRWPLLSPCVDLVWSEVLGVTAVAVARRLAHLLCTTPPTRCVSLDSVATPLCVTPA